jgi:hypothetical protein
MHGKYNIKSSFVSSLEKTATGTHKMLKTVYRKEAVSCRLVFEWFKSERYMRSSHEVLKVHKQL